MVSPDSSQGQEKSYKFLGFSTFFIYRRNYIKQQHLSTNSSMCF